jgi:hypothetical protein
MACLSCKPEVADTNPGWRCLCALAACIGQVQVWCSAIVLADGLSCYDSLHGQVSLAMSVGVWVWDTSMLCFRASVAGLYSVCEQDADGPSCCAPAAGKPLLLAAAA